ncbi:hypothetical protein PUN4_520136 [Paraburkholderia unamae]|nr:hypothetical protein PUN4_520136 [Paraburkholderia unamae]
MQTRRWLQKRQGQHYGKNRGGFACAHGGKALNSFTARGGRTEGEDVRAIVVFPVSAACYCANMTGR